MFDFLKKKTQMATRAKVEFVRTGKIVDWTVRDGSLLQFAERHNIETKKSCCKGHCGVCQVTLLSGKVFYQEDVSFQVADNQALLCSAYPAMDKSDKTPHICIDL